MAKYYFFDSFWFEYFSRKSFITSDGICEMVSLMSIGTKIKSSKSPKTGMKSGIKSIGLNKYPTVIPAKILAKTGALLSNKA